MHEIQRDRFWGGGSDGKHGDDNDDVVIRMMDNFLYFVNKDEDDVEAHEDEILC